MKKFLIGILLAMSGCIDTSLTNGYTTTIDLHGTSAIPLNNNYLTTATKKGEFVFISCNDKENCYKKDYLTIYKKDSTYSRSVMVTYYLSNADNTVFVTIPANIYRNNQDSLVQKFNVGDKVYTIWTFSGTDKMILK